MSVLALVSAPRWVRADFGPEVLVTDGSGSATQTATGLDLANNAYISSVIDERIHVRIIGPNLNVEAPLGSDGIVQGDPDFVTNARGVTFMCFSQLDALAIGEGREICIARNEGGQFSVPQFVTDNRVDDYAPRTCLDRKGDPHMVWARRVGEGQVIYRAIPHEPGTEQVAARGDYPVVFVDVGDVAHIVYVRNNDLLYINNATGTFAGERPVTTTPFEPESSVCIGGDPQGNVLVCFESKSSLYYSVKPKDRAFLPPRLVDRGSVLDPRMRVRSEGQVTIVYGKAGDIFFIQGQSSELNQPERITETPEVESHPSLEVDLSNNIHVSYIREGDVYYRNNAAVPDADFSAVPTTGEVPLTVKFTDLSSGDIQFWEWDFGDGTRSTLRNPTHVYATSDKFTVKLIARATGATESERLRTDYVVVQDPSNTLRMPDQLVFPGQKNVWFPLLAGHTEPLQAFQVMATYDPNIFVFTGYELAFTATQSLTPEFVSLTDQGTFVSGGVIVDVEAPYDGRQIPPGQNQAIFQLIFDVSDGAPQGAETEIALVNNRQLSNILNIFTIGGFTKIPTLKSSKVRILVVEPPYPRQFLRGDADGNGEIQLSDAIVILNFLFTGGRPPSCMDAADVNDTGKIDISGAIGLLSYMFLGGPPPSVPFPVKGLDPTDDPLEPCVVGG